MAKVDEDAAVGILTVKLPTFWPNALDADTIDGVLDLLEQPPDEDAYDQLKARLVQSFKMSTVDKIKRALEFPALVDENPVKLADKIMALTRGASSEDIAKTVFMLKLPDGVRKTMWAEPLATWTEMKARASVLWHADRTKTRASVYEAATVSKPDTNALKATERGQRRSKFRDFASRFTQRPDGPCVYHEFFSQTSSKCRALCMQVGNGRAGHQ